MARIRTIKPDAYASLGRQGVSIEARWFFVGMTTFSDDYGRFEWMPRRILGDIFPEDPDVSVEDVERWLTELVEIGTIATYEVNGRRYGYFPKWLKHQRVKNPGQSLHPSPPILESSVDLTETLQSSSLLEEGKEKWEERIPVGEDEQSTLSPLDSSQEVLEAELVDDAPKFELALETKEPRISPFEQVKSLLCLVAELTGEPRPLDSEIRRFVKNGSPVRELVAKYGTERAASLMAWCHRHKPHLDVKRVYSASTSLMAEMRRNPQGPQSRGSKPTSDQISQGVSSAFAEMGLGDASG
ncbi:MAG: hypothetical protein KF812_09800 [Fimbriimonadaceae bacterium]|nr:hypothetical protein [Fimbriimonadaceae bacterium]